MILVQIEKKVYKVTKTIHKTLVELTDAAFESGQYEDQALVDYCHRIEGGQIKGARLLGDISFYHTDLPF